MSCVESVSYYSSNMMPKSKIHVKIIPQPGRKKRTAQGEGTRHSPSAAVPLTLPPFPFRRHSPTAAGQSRVREHTGRNGWGIRRPGTGGVWGEGEDYGEEGGIGGTESLPAPPPPVLRSREASRQKGNELQLCFARPGRNEAVRGSAGGSIPSDSRLSLSFTHIQCTMILASRSHKYKC